jgi:hypothetical protein
MFFVGVEGIKGIENRLPCPPVRVAALCDLAFLERRANAEGLQV